MRSLTFYKNILDALHYGYDDEGLISRADGIGGMSPASVDGKRLVLPTKERLKKGFYGTETQPFHPLSESMARRGVSPIMQHIQRNAKAHLATAFIQLSEKLMEVSVDTSLHQTLPPKANAFLKKMVKADDKTKAVLNALFTSAMAKNRLITVYLKNGGTYEGKKVNRLAIIRFPIIEALASDDPKPLGVKVTQQQRDTILALFRYIVPDGDLPEEYNAGSNNRIAPFLHAFLKAYAKITTAFNVVINMYKKPLALGLKPFPEVDLVELEKMGEFYDEIPVLSGNEGGTDEVEEEQVVETKANTVVAPQVVAASAPVVAQSRSATPMREQHASNTKESGSGLSFEEVRRRLQQQQPQYYQQPQVMMVGGMPMQQQQVMVNQFGQPVQQMHVNANQYLQPQQHQQQNSFANVAMIVSGQQNQMHMQQPQQMYYQQQQQPQYYNTGSVIGNQMPVQQMVGGYANTDLLV